jgi:hypothetical protein
MSASSAVQESAWPNTRGRKRLDSPTMLYARTLAVQRGFSPIKGTIAPPAAPTALAFSHDGSELAYGFNEGSTGLAAAATGRSIATYHGYTSPVWQTSFSADGRLVATSSIDGTAAAWSSSGLVLHAVHIRGLFFEPNQNGFGVLTGAARGERDHGPAPAGRRSSRIPPPGAVLHAKHQCRALAGRTIRSLDTANRARNDASLGRHATPASSQRPDPRRSGYRTCGYDAGRFFGRSRSRGFAV